MASRRLLSKANRKEGIKLFNRDILLSKGYDDSRKVFTSKTIFYDNPFSNPVSLCASENGWATIKESLANRLCEFNEQSNVMHYEQEDYQTISNDSNQLKHIKDEIPILLKEIAFAAIKYYKEIPIDSDEEINAKMHELLDNIKNNIQSGELNVQNLDSVVHFIKKKIKETRKVILTQNPENNYFFARKRRIEEALKLKTEGEFALQEICKICKISESKFRKIIKINSADNNSPAAPARPPVKKSYLLGKEIMYLKYLADKPDKSYTAAEMKELFESRFKFPVPVETLKYHLRNTLNYSYKRTAFKHASAFKNNHKFAVYDVCKQLIKNMLLGRNIFIIDESGLQKKTDRFYSYAAKGATPCRIKKSEFQQLNLIMAITQNQVFAYQLRNGAHNELSFIGFLADLTAKIVSRGKDYALNSILFIDNASFHRSGLVKKFIDLLPFDVLYNATYSPELSAIETAFSLLKRDLRKYYPKELYILIIR